MQYSSPGAGRITKGSYATVGLDYLRAVIDRPGGGYVVAGEVSIDGSNSYCDRVQNLESELRKSPPMISQPPVNMVTTAARLVDANLTEVISDTFSDLLCSD